MKPPRDIRGRWRWWLLLGFAGLHAFCWGLLSLAGSMGFYIGASQYYVMGIHVSHRTYRWVVTGGRPALLVSGAATIAVVAQLARDWSIRLDQVDPDCCPRCGYDLRASPDRCPECGRPP